jgi:two-component system nitrate/nitrite response regulator NarL
MSIALLIADDHPLVREGLRAAFERTDITIVGEASTVAEALRFGLDQSVEVIMLDISWAEDEYGMADYGFELLSNIRCARPDVAVLMYSVQDAQSYIARCRRLRANGYLVKGVDDRLLVTAVRAVFAGEEIWPGQAPQPLSHRTTLARN